MYRVKICGITNKEDALNAIALGACSLGFIFYKDSPRYVTPEKVQEIVYFLPPFVQLVGVFVNSPIDYIHETMLSCQLDLVQLHGDENPNDLVKLKSRFIKAIHVQTESDLEAIVQFQGLASGILLDTKSVTGYGGSGKMFDWGLALKAKDLDLPIILSGGIDPANINKAIQLVNPFAIDLCSGVESDLGKKDYNKLASLFNQLR